MRCVSTALQLDPALVKYNRMSTFVVTIDALFCDAGVHLEELVVRGNGGEAGKSVLGWAEMENLAVRGQDEYGQRRGRRQDSKSKRKKMGKDRPVEGCAR